mmetsp:Transcript_1185/g.5007  ORF Transcript_1185/g.5007 Transcript_1185/m.5007 type:complete len:221 (+) Transcript_1185:468-1130(+)
MSAAQLRGECTSGQERGHAGHCLLQQGHRRGLQGPGRGHPGDALHGIPATRILASHRRAKHAGSQCGLPEDGSGDHRGLHGGHGAAVLDEHDAEVDPQHWRSAGGDVSQPEAAPWPLRVRSPPGHRRRRPSNAAASELQQMLASSRRGAGRAAAHGRGVAVLRYRGFLGSVAGVRGRAHRESPAREQRPAAIPPPNASRARGASEGGEGAGFEAGIQVTS